MTLMRHAYQQLSEIKNMEWEELVWIYDEITLQTLPPTPTKKAIGEALEIGHDRQR